MSQSPEPPSAELSFVRLATVAESNTARVDLCRVIAGPHERALVAVKRLQDDVADDPQFVKMFHDEVWMASALHHPNVVRVLGWGSDGEGAYYATEFIRGVSLARLLRTVNQTGEVFTERLIVYLASCVCKGLAAAHGLRSATGEMLNLVHRDLTPDNVLVSFQGEVKIADFGMAKAKRRSTKTMVGMVKGTCSYMAPEQVTGKPLDGRADIFAMGVVLYELFCGSRPWDAKNARETMRQILEAPLPDLNKLRPGIHSVLVSVVQRCLAKEPADRFQHAVELDQQLTQWLQSHGYHENEEHLARFVRRNAMRQMRWCERAIAGEYADGVAPAVPIPSPWAEEGRTGSESSPDQPDAGETKTRVEVPLPQSTIESSLDGEAADKAVEDVPDTRPDELGITHPDEPRTEPDESRVAQPNALPAEPGDAPTLMQRPEHVALLVPPPMVPTPPSTEVQAPADSSATLPSARELRAKQRGPASERPAGPPPPPRRGSVKPPPKVASAKVPSVPPRASVSPPRTAPGKEGAAVQKKSRELIQEATRMAAQADRAASLARRAADRAREAADQAQRAAERAEVAASAASLAQQALEFVKSGEPESARDHLQQAAQLRKSLDAVPAQPASQTSPSKAPPPPVRRPPPSTPPSPPGDSA